MKRTFAAASFLAVLAFVPLRSAAQAPRNLLSPPPSGAASTAPANWTYWSPRPDLAHEHAIVTREGRATFMLRTRGFASYGYWLARVAGIEPGKHYALDALYQTDGVPAQSGSVFAVISWYSGGNNPRELQRDYVDEHERAGPWLRVARTVQAPADAAIARIELGFRRAPAGTVYWCDPHFVVASPPPPRPVRLVTTRVLPATPPSIEGNTARMAEMFERLGPEKPDIVLFSENLNTRSVRGPLAEKAQTIPGPLTEMLSAHAKKFRTHVITTLLERDGPRFHNTAVLIGRDGRILGKYRKVHLTIGEMENGLTPGSDYPVYETDVGRIGIVTCWDNWFSESMRILRLRGAEIVFMPLAGDGDVAHWEAVWPARAIDNGVYLVTSSTVTDSPSRIFDPSGAIVAETREKFGFALKEIDLTREWRLRYLSVSNGAGEARSLYLRERRPDTYQPLLHDSEPRPAPNHAPAGP